MKVFALLHSLAYGLPFRRGEGPQAAKEARKIFQRKSLGTQSQTATVEEMPNEHPDIYESVKADILRIMAGTGDELDRIEACFMSALWHWEKFKDSVRGQSFSNRAEELRQQRLRRSPSAFRQIDWR